MGVAMQLSLFAEPFAIKDKWPRHPDACRFMREDRHRCYCARCDESRMTDGVFHKARLWTLPRCMVAAGLTWGDVPACMDGMDGPIAPRRLFGRRLPI